MTYAPIRASILLISLMAGAAPLCAQQTTAAPTPPATSTPADAAAAAPAPAAPAAPAATTTASAASKIPSPDTVKKAKLAGYRAKLKKGATVFCKEQTEIGTHFSTENCINEDQLALVLDREQEQRDSLTNHTCQGCSGK
jgi:hypothetical protein